MNGYKKRLIGFVMFIGLPSTAFCTLPGCDDGAGRAGAMVDTKHEDEQRASARELSGAFRAVAKAVGPSVVNVTTVKRSTIARGPFSDPYFENHPFREFFDRFFDQPGLPQEFEQRGLGSGVIVSEDGYILTNDHVVGYVDEVTVKLTTGETFEARVVGKDPSTDLAVVKVDAENLQPIEFGSSDDIEVGEWVLAVGNAFGLEHTVTVGIVSAKGRANVGNTDYEDFIQTDAAINPGNSGGPLVNLDGELIGINTAFVSGSGGYQGIGFAIPVKMAKAVMDDLIESGIVRRGRLGVTIQTLTDELAHSFEYDGDGVLVADVTAGGPADKAGLLAGDIVVTFNGEPVETVSELRNLVAASEPGSTATLEVFHNGLRRTVEVELEALEAEVPRVEPAEVQELGLTLRDVTPGVARQMELDEPIGVLVVDVQPGSPADRAGIRPYDIILSVNGEQIENLRSFQRMVSSHDPEDGIRILVRSEGTTRFVFVRKPQ